MSGLKPAWIFSSANPATTQAEMGWAKSNGSIIARGSKTSTQILAASDPLRKS